LANICALKIYCEITTSLPVLMNLKKFLAIKEKGYFIAPSQLFENVVATAEQNDELNIDLKKIFDAIENSANGHPSEPDIKGLFADFDTTSNRLGNSVHDKNKTLAKVLKGV